MAYEQKFVTVPEAEKSKIKMPTHLVSGEDSLCGSQWCFLAVNIHRISDKLSPEISY